jgi:hypothetical protein
MWESIRVRVSMWLSFGVHQISRACEHTGNITYHSVALFQVFFVEVISARVRLWRAFPAGFWGGNLLLGQRLPELGCSINRHVSLSKWKLGLEVRGVFGSQESEGRSTQDAN